MVNNGRERRYSPLVRDPTTGQLGYWDWKRDDDLGPGPLRPFFNTSSNVPLGFGLGLGITVGPIIEPEDSEQKKEPCPPVPEAPPGASIDDNIRRARQHRPNGAFFAYDDAKWFKSMVTHKAPWDYKRIHIKYENFGNFNLGATGAAIGFSQVTLLSEAGKLQAVPPGMAEKPKEWGYPAGRLWGKGEYPYGDEPKDAKQIEAGMNYYLRKFVKKDCQ